MATKTSTKQTTQQAAKSSTTSKRKPTTKKSAAKSGKATASSKTAKQPRWGFEPEASREATTGAADQRQAPEAKPEAPPSPTSTVNGDGDQLVVFAIRLTRAERDAIHEAAGSGKASRFVRGVALAAARRDVSALQAVIAEAKARRAQ